MKHFFQYLVEIDAWNGSGIETIQICGHPQFGAGWLPYLADAGLIKFNLFSGSKTYGPSSFDYGSIIFTNKPNEAKGETAGALDYLRDYSFDGRAIRVLQGQPGTAYGSFTTIINATISGIQFDWDQIEVTLRSKHVELDDYLDGGTFLGNNILPAGIEGIETDLKDKPKPILFGRVYNAQPVLCNTSKLIYAISPATGVAATYMGAQMMVYDNGVPLTFEGTYTDQLDMEANEPTPGCYRVWEVGGCFRLGASPAGQITFDACSYGRSVTAKASNLIIDILTLAGKSSLIDSASFAAVAAAVTYENGIYVTDKRTISDVIDELCASGGLYRYFNLSGQMVIGQFVDPSTIAVDHVLTTATRIENFNRSVIQDTPDGLPVHTVSLNCVKNYSVQNQIAGSVSAERKAWVADGWRTAKYTDASVKTTHPLAGELIFDTTLTAVQPVEALRRFNLYSVERDLVTLDVDIDYFTGVEAIVPGACFQLTLNDRFNFTDKKMILVGYTVNLNDEMISLVLWG